MQECLEVTAGTISIHTNSIISFVETFRVFWECNFKNKMLAGKTVYMCGEVMRKVLKWQIDYMGTEDDSQLW